MVRSVWIAESGRFVAGRTFLGREIRREAMPHALLRRAVTIGLVLFAIASSGCEGGNESVRASVSAAERSVTNPATNQVSIDNFTFSPQTLTVSSGATVVWLNRDDVPHSIVSTDKLFKSELLDTDEKFSFTFIKPGEYPYFCGIHPHMTGKIVVK
jgi:plastocyanin